MVHHVTLYKLRQPDAPHSKIEELMLATRIMLLKIPEVLSVRCGKNIDPDSEWPFFISLEFETLEKLAVVKDDPIYLKFENDVIRMHTHSGMELRFEMTPGKKVRNS